MFGKDDEQEGYAFYNNGRIDYSPFEGFAEPSRRRRLLTDLHPALPQGRNARRWVALRSRSLSALRTRLRPRTRTRRHLDKAAGLAVHHLTNVSPLTEAGFEMPKADFESLSLPWHKPSFTVTTPGKASDYVRTASGPGRR